MVDGQHQIQGRLEYAAGARHKAQDHTVVLRSAVNIDGTEKATIISGTIEERLGRASCGEEEEVEA
jgi:hypothetical protein